ncbi:YggS family pyridoxal phosphate-dependent enzyme [Candidatus Poribacteria bacterium]|nr:YggS family pyridoxal phosphate-dependent enzyme [Candidatus Poribacteria bacterium]
MPIADRLSDLQSKVADAASRSGRRADDVLIVAVSKMVPCESIAHAIAAGIQHVGENKVQEADPKIGVLGRQVTWHMVGHLQTNKVKRAVELFDWIQSVDSVRLLDRINRQAEALEMTPRVLLQVNTSGEPSKFGASPGDLETLVHFASECRHVGVEGLMTIGPLTHDEAAVRKSFQRLRTLAETARSWKLPRVSFAHLSMGMSGDYVTAIEEGATIIRIGSAIFGPRPRATTAAEPT